MEGIELCAKNQSMSKKVNPKNVKRIDLNTMFKIHMDQFKLNEVELKELRILDKIKLSFYNGVVQALIVMNEMKKDFPDDQMNHLLSDLMVQADQYFTQLSIKPAKT